MRIIRGTLKGQRFTAPKSIKARPTTDFAKESLFNILENQIDIDHSSVLDLFSGTGNISFEMASRGANKIISVDKSFQSVKFIQNQSKKWDLPILARKMDAFKFLEACKLSFDIIFADPPYDIKGVDKIPDLVFENNLLNPNGILIVEHGQEYDLAECRNFIEHRNYSRVNFSFFSAEK